ncbi:hypothetical protein P3T76_010336 [Phytophthora citrophthora]|uniref:RxLR effector protein n=1 Tax=Phytophthora citrophthora TaxID=4793 RepID=A0AAD9GC58_9STRA|nr:hypothetical protein P3T76_010336 [Phytophthora citrophthora]
MRLTYVVLVATTAILACCDGASVVSNSKRLAVPQRHVQTESINNRFLRVHQEVVDEEEEEEEERNGPQLTKSLSEKFLNKAAEKVAARLTKSKSFNELSKLDDAYYTKALTGNEKYILDKNKVLFQRIEDMGYNPESMLTKMKQLEGNAISHQYNTLLDHYTTYWMAKYPSWTANKGLRT